jgi:hypothetical protein
MRPDDIQWLQVFPREGNLQRGHPLQQRGGPNKPITWWEPCPECDTCTGSLATIDDLISCVDTSADTIVNELICFQFPRNNHADWPCPTDVP